MATIQAKRSTKIDEIKTYHIPTLALRGVTIFPNVLFHFDVGRIKSVKALEQAMAGGQRVFLVTQKDVHVEDPGKDDLYSIGFFDYLENGVLIIEWSENIEAVLPEDCIRIKIQEGSTENSRIFTIEGEDFLESSCN